MLKNYFTILIILLLSIPIKAQKKTFNRQDSLRGGITKYRKWWDLTHYDLSLTVNPKDSSIQGTNIIEYQDLKDGNTMQIDLQKPMSITKVSQDNQPLSFIREGNVYFINLDSETKTKEKKEDSLSKLNPKPIKVTDMMTCKLMIQNLLVLRTSTIGSKKA